MPSNTSAPPTTFYRLPKVREICGGVSASTVWGWVKQSEKTGFPSPIKLSENVTAWESSSLEKWAQSRIAASRNSNTRCDHVADQ